VPNPTPPFDDRYPYRSQRMAVYASRGVATSQPLAAQAGLEVMRQGGNAVDAAIATAATLTVVEPTSNGLGSDAFALVWSGGRLHALNASGRSPANTDASEYPINEPIDPKGWAGVTVPGAVAGWAELHRQLGRLPFAELMRPAIRYAAEGFLVSPMTAASWRSAFDAYDTKRFAAWHQAFAPQGRPPSVGERIVMPDHARTLERLAQSRGEALYQGELAQAVERAAIDAGSPLRAADLAQHRCDWVEPIHVDYAGLRLHEMPPNGQGLAALIALGILKRFDLPAKPVDSAASLHLQIEAMKLAFADAHRYIADPATMDTTTDALLDDAYLDQRAARIDERRAQDFDHGSPKPGGTVLLTAADEQGQMVSFIQSNYMGFGSGVVVPATGVSLQNRGAGFTLEADHPNRVAPAKRPLHTIIPGFLRDPSGAPLMSFGVMGGPMQAQGHVQMVLRTQLWGQNPQAACDAPRWRVTGGRGVALETGLPANVYDGLTELGHDLTVEPPDAAFGFGGAQLIARLEHGYIAGSDGRKDGCAVGF